jgi:hypothetical protein
LYSNSLCLWGRGGLRRRTQSISKLLNDLLITSALNPTCFLQVLQIRLAYYKCFKSVLRTLPKFVLFSNQNVRRKNTKYNCNGRQYDQPKQYEQPTRPPLIKPQLLNTKMTLIENLSVRFNSIARGQGYGV